MEGAGIGRLVAALVAAQLGAAVAAGVDEGIQLALAVAAPELAQLQAERRHDGRQGLGQGSRGFSIHAQGEIRLAFGPIHGGVRPGIQHPLGPMLPHRVPTGRPIRQIQIRLDLSYNLYGFAFGGSLGYGF